MAAEAIAYTYRYPFPSSLDAANDGAHLRLATCTRADEHPYFFAGTPRQPYLFGKMLLVLSDVVRTRFYDPERWRVALDPVVTASESMLRFEGFSSCCGVYARADLPAEFFDTEIAGRGTTNVDFNDPMRAALTRLRDTDSVRLAVGRDEVALERCGETTVEKKVKLPVRWLKGFGEVQTYQAALEPRLEAPAAEALRFVRTLPTSSGLRRPTFVVRSGRSLRLSPRERPGAVRLDGTHRARVIEPLLPGAETLRLWADDGAGVTAWEVIHESARIVLVLSPEVHRGFSGEGQLLELLASGTWRDLARSVRARLHWQTRIDDIGLADELGVPVDQVHHALAALGATGLAGYDLDAGAYFHRELPFDLEQIEALQPRLKNARQLLADDGVRIVDRRGDVIDLAIRGTGVWHQVRLAPDGNRCTCRWWSRYQGRRGPCKHVLAARLLIDAQHDVETDA